MKIAIVIEHFDASRGGAERLAGWVAREMARRGHDVHVICHDVAARVNRYRQATQRASFDAHRSRHAQGTAYAMQMAEASEPNQPPESEGGHATAPPAVPWRVHVHRLQGMRLHTALGFRLFGRRARDLCRRGIGGEFDVVHSFTVACPGDIYHAQVGVYAAMQAQAAAMRQDGPGRAWKQLLQQLPGKQRTLLTLEQRAFHGPQAATLIISTSLMLTRQLADFYGIDDRRVVTLATPWLEGDGALGRQPGEHEAKVKQDRAWFRAHYGIGPDDRVALLVGHDFRRKGLRQAIEAIARTAAWKLVVVGLGKVREYVERAQALGLMAGADAESWGPAGQDGQRQTGAARVLFVGPTHEMAAVYAAADALLLPAYYEPSSVVVLEALAHGLPVVCSALVGAAELVAEYHAGMVVADPEDVTVLAAALGELPQAGSNEGRALTQRAHRAAGSRTAAGFADRLEALYRAASSRPRRHEGREDARST